MLISTDWIKDFVEIPETDAKKMSERVTLATAEVEGVLTSNSHLKDISIVQIKCLRKHPDADKLNLVTFQLNNNGETKEVVCGAPNVREGLKVPYAKLGVTLPNGLTLEPKKIRGFLSEGMLCSGVELGLGEDSSGLLELEDSAPLGKDMLSYTQAKEDVLLDIDNKSLTHRPDLWGHYGFAREFAAIWSQNLKTPYDESWSKSIESKFSKDTSPIKPELKSDSAGLCYWGLCIDGITVGESPNWIQQRLISCGLRPINSIVDISNYVMLELGIPNHIFDRSKIVNNELVIERVGKKSKFTTLDEIERDLIESDTIIRDSVKPLVIAGIMGGSNSGVDETTTSVFLEVANWKAAEVRRTSTRLGLRTDSSQRYEKSLDSKLTYRTLLRLAELILELNPNARIVGKAEYSGEDLSAIKTLIIDLSAEKVRNELGKDVSTATMENILQSLDFKVSENSDTLSVEVPSWRATKDIECDADLVEEVGRIIGYDNIDPVSPLAEINTTRFDHIKTLHRKIQDFLIFQARSLEVMTYPMVGETLLNKAKWPVMNEGLKLVNALSTDADRMRPTMLPSILEAVSLNQKNFDKFQFFELGRSYASDDKTFSMEKSQLAIVCFSKNENRFVELINTTENLLRSLNIPGDLIDPNEKFVNPLLPIDWLGNHPYERQDIRIMGKSSGFVMSIHPLMLRKFKIKGNLSVAIVDLTEVEKRPLKAKTKYTPLAKFPSSQFDCTVVADANTTVSQVLSALKKVKAKELTSSKVVDVYQLSDEQKSVTIKSNLYNPDATLEGDRIKELENLIVKTLDQAGFPLKS